jgi:hypothetical protein
MIRQGSEEYHRVTEGRARLVPIPDGGDYMQVFKGALTYQRIRRHHFA